MKFSEVYELVASEWTVIGNLPTPRYLFACGVVSTPRGTEIIAAGNLLRCLKQFYLMTVFAGGYEYVTSTDILNLNAMVWRRGPDLPYGFGLMGYNQYKNTLLLSGGKVI